MWESLQAGQFLTKETDALKMVGNPTPTMVKLQGIVHVRGHHETNDAGVREESSRGILGNHNLKLQEYF